MNKSDNHTLDCAIPESESVVKTHRRALLVLHFVARKGQVSELEILKFGLPLLDSHPYTFEVEFSRAATNGFGVLVALSFWLGTTAKAQLLGGPLTIQWQKAYGSIYYESGTYIRPARDGYLMMGTTSAFGPTDLCLSRLDDRGEVVWQKYFGGSGFDVGNGFITYPDGSSISLVYSPGPTGSDRLGTWFSKFGPNGDLLWSGTMGGDQPHIAATRNGGALVGTSVRGAVYSISDGTVIYRGRYMDAAISKFAADGTNLWNVSYHISFTNRMRDLLETRDGGILVGGTAPTAQSLWQNDYLLIRLDSQGQYLWSTTYGGTNNDNLIAVREMSDGGFLLGGESSSPASNSKSSPSFGGLDCWILKVDSEGRKQWDKTYGGSGDDQLRDLVLLSDGGFVAAATSDSTNGNKTAPSFGTGDAWLIRCDATGNVLWEQSIGGSDFDGIISLSQTPDGGLIAGIDSYSAQSGNKNTPNLGLSDNWVVKLASERPSLRWERSLPNRSDWSLVLGGFSNVVYRVEASTNLVTWSHIQTIQMAGVPTEILRQSQAAVTNTYLFYRAAIVP